MVCTNENHIISVKDVKTFFHYIVYGRKVIHHLEELFEYFASSEGVLYTFSLEECSIFNRLMDDCSNVCKKEGVEIYSIGHSELQLALGITVA